MAGVAVGGVLTAGVSALQTPHVGQLALAAVSAVLIGGAANSLNDVFDLEVDRINRPERPLPSGKVTRETAWWVWGVGSAAGVLGSFWLSAWHVGLAVATVALLYGYSAWLKRVPLFGNVAVSIAIGLALIYGGTAVGPARPALVGAVFAVLANLAREIIKDVQDARGDAAAGMRTFPLATSRSTALRTAAGILAALIALTPLPFLLLDYSGGFLLLVLVADGLLLRVLWLLRGTRMQRIGRASALVKWGMVIGMAALAAAGLSGTVTA